MTERVDSKIPAIAVDNLGFSYGSESIFRALSFTVKQGDYAVLAGANGTGKSTLLRLILNELCPASGGIELYGQAVSEFKSWFKVGYVPQNALGGNGGFPATVQEIVEANLYSQVGFMRLPRKEQHLQAAVALDRVGMGAYAKRLIGELSGGQQQRVMLARVLVSKPTLMLLDEPTTGVDQETVQELYQLLKRLNEELGLTLLMVTHDLDGLAGYASRILQFKGSKLVEQDLEGGNEHA